MMIMSSKQPLPTNDLIGTMSKDEIATLISTLPTFEAQDFTPDIAETDATDMELIEPQFNLQAVKREELVVPDTSVDPNLEADFNLATANLRAIIQNSDTVFRDLVSIARASESPRAYEVVANMINTLVTANNELINMHKKHLEIKHKEFQILPPQTVENQTVTNNNMFVGTPTDLLDMIKTLQQPVEKEINNVDQS